MRKKKEIKYDAEYYDNVDLLGIIVEEDVDISLDDTLRDAILHKKRRKPMKNISIKMDPFILIGIKKIATQKGIPYQNLIRLWVTEEMKKELNLDSC
ncbi:hypothetical protein LCGC14_2177920 [marine sediment metagenome]|uniref:Antitoxin n=1 Tax=marine sediment metagenome TaxID=412755 RepID=A0A0F9DN45_9ZZZZ